MSQELKNTCNKEKCYWWLEHGEYCVNFVQMNWRKENSNQIYTTDDCAPKRTAYMLQEIFPRLIGLQQASEQERNESKKLVGGMMKIVQLTTRQKTYMIEGQTDGNIR